ncbi:hypothetical protein KP509_16G052800 [Ceratopteris richardii]|uniref:Uncharacterized protein n=2 Tax=Ceratopteris richardii TaxID=49495 RepID=A0A8T2T0C7_CERRI|nr:hypothetical protein KP509_16G052800 [Ceratopteris richardii]
MALSSPENRVSPEFSNDTVSDARSEITTRYVWEGYLHGAPSEKPSPQAVTDPSSLNFFKKANMTPISQSFRSSFSSFRTILPVVPEEDESISNRDGSSVWDVSSASPFSADGYMESSFRKLFLKGLSTTNFNLNRGSGKSRNITKGNGSKRLSFMLALFRPLRKVRDRYVSCMMGLNGNGDMSSIAQGFNFGSSSRYFAAESRLEKL